MLTEINNQPVQYEGKHEYQPGMVYYAVEDYEAEEEDELNLLQNDRVIYVKQERGTDRVWVSLGIENAQGYIRNRRRDGRGPLLAKLPRFERTEERKQVRFRDEPEILGDKKETQPQIEDSLILTPITGGRKQLIRVYAGNFSTADDYRTLQMSESLTLQQIARHAIGKFRLDESTGAYLTVEHHQTRAPLPLPPPSTITLGEVIELAKTVSARDEQSGPGRDRQKRLSLKRLAQRLTRLNGVYNSMALVETSSDDEPNALTSRDPSSDFQTPYRFVLNLL